MSSDIQSRLYNMEAAPPAEVWARLSADLDEINADNRFSRKIYETEAFSSAGSWEKIQSALENRRQSPARGILIHWKRLAAAAIFAGLVFTAWFVFFHNTKNNDEIVSGGQSQEKTTPVQNPGNPALIKAGQNNDAPKKDPIVLTENNPVKPGGFTNVVASLKQRIKTKEPVLIPDAPDPAILGEATGENTFSQAIDDLTLVTADDGYMTMVNANGRMLKIPAHLAHLGPYMQDKPLNEDYFEIMFGEGAFWKEKFSEWRRQIASSSSASGDIFSTVVELLKSVQAK